LKESVFFLFLKTGSCTLDVSINVTQNWGKCSRVNLRWLSNYA